MGFAAVLRELPVKVDTRDALAVGLKKSRVGSLCKLACESNDS